MCIRSFLVRVLAIVLCTGAGFGSIAAAAEPRIAVSRSPLSLPFFVAKEKNLFAKYKVEPVVVECLGGDRCMKELVEGRVDMATSTELPFMFAVFDGAPISLITTFVTNKDDMRFIVRKSVLQQGGVKSLTGKRVGYVEKASSHYYRDLFLLYQGIDPQAIVPVPMGGEALATALAKGEVDAISVWEPWAHVALKLGGPDVALVDAPRLYSQSFNLMARNDYRVPQARRVSAVLAALSEAIQFIKKNPEEAKRILARDAGVDPEIAEIIWPTYRFELSLQQSLLTTVQGQARWARREGHVNKALGEPEFLNYIDASLLRKLSAKAVDYVYP
ncbi:MAG: ABC transporter substrate-binding protein [Limnobacter sp.]|uniref:ABC transporter substrate-binding protein n=1 Tax=Limnobacter sp. TaxID=2003368 RepID=UPI0032EE7EBE